MPPGMFVGCDCYVIASATFSASRTVSRSALPEHFAEDFRLESGGWPCSVWVTRHERCHRGPPPLVGFLEEAR